MNVYDKNQRKYISIVRAATVFNHQKNSVISALKKTIIENKSQFFLQMSYIELQFKMWHWGVITTSLWLLTRFHSKLTRFYWVGFSVYIIRNFKLICRH